MFPVHRGHDGELTGYVSASEDGTWIAWTVFHGELSTHPSRTEAERDVRERGLASLAERWHWYSRAEDRWEVVVLQEVHPGRVTAAVGYYSLPQSPTVVISAADLAAGDRLLLGRPPEAPAATFG